MLYSYAIRAMEDSDLSNAYVMKMPDNLSDLPDFHLMTYDDDGVGNSYYANGRNSRPSPEAIMYSCFT